jgi:hypothetical protein
VCSRSRLSSIPNEDVFRVDAAQRWSLAAGEREALPSRNALRLAPKRKIAPLTPVGYSDVLGGVAKCVREPRPSAPTGMRPDRHVPRPPGSDGHALRAPGSDRHPPSCSGTLWLRTILRVRCWPLERSAPTVGPDGHEARAPGSDRHGAGVPGSDGQRPRRASAPTTASTRKESCRS